MYSWWQLWDYNTELVQLVVAVCGISLQHSHYVQLVAVVGCGISLTVGTE